MSTSTGEGWRVGARRRRVGNALDIAGTSPNRAKVGEAQRLREDKHPIFLLPTGLLAGCWSYVSASSRGP